MVFFHIPPMEYISVWNTEKCVGSRYEDVACWAAGDHFLERVSNIQATVAGHDHYNDYIGTYKGVDLIYGRKTGYGGYGPEPYLLKGARVFVIDLDD